MNTHQSETPSQPHESTTGSNTLPSIAVVTVTYNAADFIETFLDSLFPILENFSSLRLVLVDNDSQDETCQIIKTKIENAGLNETVTLLETKKNSGFGIGCNTGADYSQQFSPDYIWFLNPDTIVTADAILALAEEFERNQHADFVGSILKDENNEIRPGAFRFPGLLNTFSQNLRFGLFDKLFPNAMTAYDVPQQPHVADWLTGASFMVKANVFHDLKGFDPEYFLYFEEVDLFLRAKRKGYQAWTCPKSKIFHISGASTGTNTRKSIPKRKPKYWFESRRYFYIKNYGGLYFFLIDKALITGHLLFSLRTFIQRKEAYSTPKLISDILAHSLIFGKGKN